MTEPHVDSPQPPREEQIARKSGAGNAEESVYTLGHHPSELRYCTRCKQNKPIEQFRPNPETLSGLHTWCRPCCTEDVRRWRAENPDTVKAYNEARRVPPTELICTECGEEYYGRKDRLTCSRPCKDSRYRRLHPEEYRAKHGGTTSVAAGVARSRA